MIAISSLQEAVQHMHQPARKMKYTLVWCAAGRATIVVDENEFVLKANSVITITSGQVHYIKSSKAAKGYLLEFSFDFFCKNDRDIELVFHNSLFCHFAMNELTLLGRSGIVGDQLAIIEEELSKKPYQYLHSVHSRIELLLIAINRAKITQGSEIYKPDALFLKFLEKVRDSFQQKLSIKQMAAALGTTEAKLNELSRLHTGKTAQAVVYGLVASEAKRLFTYEKLSVKEVAYVLGFADPFYFSNFFKKQTKESPKTYREKHAV
jgi:AraC family transcriptional regulator, transcriptional activator of pobA